MINQKLPRWAYLALSVPCVAAGVWASSITLQYFAHGAAALETDPTIRTLATSAAMLLVVLGMAAFGLAALMTEAQLWARRWALGAFSSAVMLLEIATIISVQMAMATGAVMAQGAVVGDLADLQHQVAQIEAQAASYAATAAVMRTNGKPTKAAPFDALAAAERAKTAPLYIQISAARNAVRPTLVGMLGERAALAYVIVRGGLIALGGVVFLGAGGALVRLGLQGDDAPDTPQVRQPAAKVRRKITPVTFAGIHLRSRFSGQSGRAFVGRPAAQPAPVTPPAPADAPAQVQKVHSVPERVQVQKEASAKVRQVPAGLRAAIESGECKPSQGAIKLFAGCGQETAEGYLSQLAADGVIVKRASGKGWVRA